MDGSAPEGFPACGRAEGEWRDGAAALFGCLKQATRGWMVHFFSVYLMDDAFFSSPFICICKKAQPEFVSFVWPVVFGCPNPPPPPKTREVHKLALGPGFGLLRWCAVVLDERSSDSPARVRASTACATPKPASRACEGGWPLTLSDHILGPPVVRLPIFGGGPPTKMDYRKKGYTLIPSSLLEDLVSIRQVASKLRPCHMSHNRD